MGKRRTTDGGDIDFGLTFRAIRLPAPVRGDEPVLNNDLRLGLPTNEGLAITSPFGSPTASFSPVTPTDGSICRVEAQIVVLKVGDPTEGATYRITALVGRVGGTLTMIGSPAVLDIIRSAQAIADGLTATLAISGTTVVASVSSGGADAWAWRARLSRFER